MQHSDYYSLAARDPSSTKSDIQQPISIIDRYRNKYQRKILILSIPLILFFCLIFQFLHNWNNPPNLINYPFTPELRTFQEHVKPIDPINATAIFNTIHNVLSPKGSEINPVGVGFFPGIIRQGTLLYHGTNKKFAPIPDKFDWIALDYEFSLNFIDRRRGERPPPPPPSSLDKDNDIPIMLTFSPSRDLKILLLDGSSGAKTTETGEMDTQSILANIASGETYDEWNHTELICNWANQHGYDGIVRVEVSYEVIICDFSKKDTYNLVNNVTIPSTESFFPFNSGSDIYKTLESKVNALISFDQAEAGARYDINGDHRILLDYRGFQTPLNRSFVAQDPYLRRVHNISNDLKAEIVNDLKLYPSKINPYLGTNWKLVTSGIVDKFTPLLSIMNATLSSAVSHLEGEDKSVIVQDIENLLIFTTSFMKGFQSNEKLPEKSVFQKNAIYQYTHAYAPISTESEHLIWSSLVKVTQMVLEPIFKSFKLSRELITTQEPLKLTSDSKLQIIHLSNLTSELISLLNWSSFYQCKDKCKPGEICYTPSWGPSPIGGHPKFGHGGPVPSLLYDTVSEISNNDYYGNFEQVGLYKDKFGKLRISRELKCVGYDIIFKRE